MRAAVLLVKDGAHRAVRASGARAWSTGSCLAPLTSRAVGTVVDVLPLVPDCLVPAGHSSFAEFLAAASGQYLPAAQPVPALSGWHDSGV